MSKIYYKDFIHELKQIAEIQGHLIRKEAAIIKELKEVFMLEQKVRKRFNKVLDKFYGHITGSQ
jgi:hypothetical protein